MWKYSKKTFGDKFVISYLWHMNEKLKKIIFSKLYQDLSHAEIIEHAGSIWFIDRVRKYWYLEYRDDGVLYWRHIFFTDFFELFSMQMNEFEKYICGWVEEVLNCKIKTQTYTSFPYSKLITDIFNLQSTKMDNLLNCERSFSTDNNRGIVVGQVLNDEKH